MSEAGTSGGVPQPLTYMDGATFPLIEGALGMAARLGSTREDRDVKEAAAWCPLLRRRTFQ